MNWDPRQNSQFFRCCGVKSIASATCWMDMSTDERLARILWQKSQPRGDWSNALLLDEAAWKKYFFFAAESCSRGKDCSDELHFGQVLKRWRLRWRGSEHDDHVIHKRMACIQRNQIFVYIAEDDHSFSQNSFWSSVFQPYLSGKYG